MSLSELEYVDIPHTQEGLLGFREHMVASLQDAFPELFFDPTFSISSASASTNASPASLHSATTSAVAAKRDGDKETVNLDEMRVVVLGDPAAGKSSLVLSISNSEKNWLEKKIDQIGSKPPLSTDGIDISSLQLSHLTFNFWDFAGKSEYQPLIFCNFFSFIQDKNYI